MKTFVVCISDSVNADRRTPVMVQDDTTLGRVAQMAIDDFMSTFGERVKFPVFVDIHLAEQFGSVHWLHPHATAAE